MNTASPARFVMQARTKRDAARQSQSIQSRHPAQLPGAQHRSVTCPRVLSRGEEVQGNRKRFCPRRYVELALTLDHGTAAAPAQPNQGGGATPWRERCLGLF